MLIMPLLKLMLILKLMFTGSPPKHLQAILGWMGAAWGAGGSLSRSQHFVEEIDNAFIRQTHKIED